MSCSASADAHILIIDKIRWSLRLGFTKRNPLGHQAVLRSLGYLLPVTRVLTNLCTTSSQLETLPEFLDLPRDEQFRLTTLYSRVHLPQGAPASPALANLVAFRLDGRLGRLAEKAGLRALWTRIAEWQHHPDFRAHLLGCIGWVRQLNPGRADKLMKIFSKIPQA